MWVYCLMLILSMTGAMWYSLGSGLNHPYNICIGPFKTNGVKIFSLSMAFIPLFWVSSLRLNVGTDYKGYAGYFQIVAATGKLDYIEPAYVLLNKLVAAFTNDYRWIFIATSAIIIGLIFRTIVVWSDNIAWSIFTFVTMGYYFGSMNGIRQYIAVAIVFWGIGYLIKGNIFKYIITIIAAAQFHKTALVMLLFAFLLRHRMKTSYYIAITMAASLIALFRQSLLELVFRFYPHYRGSVTIEREFFTFDEMIFYIVVFLLFLFMGIIYYKKLIQTPKGVVLFNSIFYCFIIYMFFSFVPAINRVGLYLEINLLLFIPCILSLISNKKDKHFFSFAVAGSLLMIFVITIGIFNRFDVLPYFIS